MELDPRLMFEIIGALYYEKVQMERKIQQAAQQAIMGGPEVQPEPGPIERMPRPTRARFGPQAPAENPDGD